MVNEDGFSFDTIKNFGDHINKSIPNYSEISNFSYNISKYFIEDDTNVYDVGCATGNLITRMAEIYPNTHCIGIDNAVNLLKETNPIDNLIFDKHDLNTAYNFNNASMVLSLFTLQFLSPKSRQERLNEIYNGLNVRGGFIIAEKIYSTDAMIQDIFTFLYYDLKKAHFTEEEILLKEVSLRKILKPLTLEGNLKMLHNAGFEMVEVFVRYYNFVGVLCIK